MTQNFSTCMVPPPIGNIDTGLPRFPACSAPFQYAFTGGKNHELTFVMPVTCLYFSFFDDKAHTQAENVPTVVDVHGVFLEPCDGR